MLAACVSFSSIYFFCKRQSTWFVMAGVVPISGKTTGRKQWTLQGGPRCSLKRLRSQLAEDGCPESQVVLAKQLLEETCELDTDKEENERLGVYWLIKASEQGNVEATKILAQCLKTGQGITEHNFIDVKACLSMPQDEKLARKAAREMFSSLSAGQDFITTNQLKRRISEVKRKCNNKGNNSNTCDKNVYGLGYGEGNHDSESEFMNAEAEVQPGGISERDYRGEKLTEDHLVSAAVNYSQGELPLVHRILTLTSPQHQDLENLNFIQRTFIQPLGALCDVYYKIVETIAKQGSSFVSSLFPAALSHGQTLILFILYSLLGTDNILLFIPMLLYYISFSVMVVSTFQMMHHKQEFHDFRTWSHLFLSYSGGELNPEEAEFQYCRNKMKPFIHFFVALLINLMIYPLIAPEWTPQSEFTVIAFFLTMLTLYIFMNDKPSIDFLILFSFAINVLAKYPYETDAVVRQGWRFLDFRVPTFASYIVGNGVEFCLNFRAVFYLLIPAIFVKIASRNNWRGTYKSLIPHCVTLSWWQMAVISSQGATWYGLIRSALALVGLILIIPVTGIASILIPLAAVAKYFVDSAIFIPVLVTLILTSVPLLIVWYSDRRRRDDSPRSCIEKYIKQMQIFIAIASVVLFVLPVIQDHGRAPLETDNNLTWEQYQNFCHQPAWEQSSVAAVEFQCSQLSGTQVNWEGYVIQAHVSSVSNVLQNIVNKLPAPLAEAISCLYGDKNTMVCDAQSLSKNEYHRCKLFQGLKLQKSKCHLEMWDIYEFEITLRMISGIWGTGPEITLHADNTFRNFTLALKPGDKVWFTGKLVNKDNYEGLLGGPKPCIDLIEIGCINCQTSDLQIQRKVVTNFKSFSVEFIYEGIKSVLNFLFNPLVIFK